MLYKIFIIYPAWRRYGGTIYFNWWYGVNHFFDSTTKLVIPQVIPHPITIVLSCSTEITLFLKLVSKRLNINFACSQPLDFPRVFILQNSVRWTTAGSCAFSIIQVAASALSLWDKLLGAVLRFVVGEKGREESNLTGWPDHGFLTGQVTGSTELVSRRVIFAWSQPCPWFCACRWTHLWNKPEVPSRENIVLFTVV